MHISWIHRIQCSAKHFCRQWLTCTELHMKSRVGHLLSNEHSECSLEINIFLVANGSDFPHETVSSVMSGTCTSCCKMECRKEVCQSDSCRVSAQLVFCDSTLVSDVSWCDRIWVKILTQVLWTDYVHCTSSRICLRPLVSSWESLAAHEESLDPLGTLSVTSRNLCKFNVYQYLSNLRKLVVHFPASKPT